MARLPGSSGARPVKVFSRTDTVRPCAFVRSRAMVAAACSLAFATAASQKTVRRLPVPRYMAW